MGDGTRLLVRYLTVQYFDMYQNSSYRLYFTFVSRASVVVASSNRAPIN
jgi:hypothetical protein